MELPSLEELQDLAHVVAIPTRTRFRGISVREAVIFEAPNGASEFSPFPEYDDAEAEQEVRRVTEGWDCSGLVRVDDLPNKVGYFAPDGDHETLGGVIMLALGRIPAEGDVVLLPETDRDILDEFESGLAGRWYARILEMDGRRVDRALLIPITDERAKEMFDR